MELFACFDKTLNKYGISVNWLSEASGVNAQMISRFRNGRNEIRTDTLEKLIEPLPTEAKEYFFSLLMGSRMRVNLEILVENLTTGELYDLFDLVAARVTRRSRQLEVGSHGDRSRVPA
jgi:DNA-binding Xre family transcriptional regulator